MQVTKCKLSNENTIVKFIVKPFSNPNTGQTFTRENGRGLKIYVMSSANKRQGQHCSCVSAGGEAGEQFSPAELWGKREATVWNLLLIIPFKYLYIFLYFRNNSPKSIQLFTLRILYLMTSYYSVAIEYTLCSPKIIFFFLF